MTALQAGELMFGMEVTWDVSRQHWEGEARIWQPVNRVLAQCWESWSSAPISLGFQSAAPLICEYQFPVF